MSADEHQISMAGGDRAERRCHLDDLIDTRAGLALANAAWQEGASKMLRYCNDDAATDKPVSPYSAPLLRAISKSARANGGDGEPDTGAVAFHRLSRPQLLTLAIALQDQRDRALATVREQAAQIERVREQGESLDGLADITPGNDLAVEALRLAARGIRAALEPTP